MNTAARALVSAACVLAPFLFVLSLPWNDLGLWSQVETAAVGLHALSAAAALGLVLLVSAGDGRTRSALTSAPVVLLAALGVLGLVLAPFVPEPWRNVHGTLKHGIGSLWHVELAVLASAYAAIRGTRGGTAAVIATAAAAAAIILLHAFPFATSIGLPLSFNEWVGLMAAAAGAGILAWSPRLVPLAAPVIAGGWLVSDNRAVLLAFAAVGVLWAASRVGRLKGLLDRPAVSAAVPVAIALAGAVALWAAAPVVERLATRGAVVDTSRIPSTNPIDHVQVQEGFAGTLWSRSYMIRAAVDATFGAPSRILAGHGWGSFPTLSIGTVRDVPGRMTESAPPTASLTYWDVRERANFHVHNVAVEALLALGLPGLALWLAFLGFLAASSRKGLYLSTGIAVLGTFWFPVNLLTPMLALALASAMPSRDPEAGAEGVTPAAMAAAGGLLLASAAAMLSALVLFGLARIEHQERYFGGVALPTDVRTCSAVTSPLAPHAEVNIDLYRMLANRVRKASDPAQELVDRTSNVLSFSCVLRRYWNETGNVAALAASLEVRAALLNVSRAAAPILANDIAKWADDVDAMLEAAPGRTDYAVPYVAEMRVRQVPDARVAGEARRLAARMAEGDPVRHWLLFVAADASGDVAEGQRRLARALELGFANLFPVLPASLPGKAHP